MIEPRASKVPSNRRRTSLNSAVAIFLLRDGQLNSYARISPDGQWIVFDKWWNNDETNGEIMIMKRDGSELKRLTENDVYDGYPAWFPDSRRILYSSEAIRGTAPTRAAFAC